MAQKLDAEDAEQRQIRLQNILERLNGDGPSETPTEPSHLSFDFGDRRTFGVDPPTELLSRVQQFLPQLEQSNAELAHRDPQSIDIEHIEETDERVIQMNLGLGVFEQRRAGASSAESGSDTTSESDSDSSSSSSSSSSASSSSSSSTGSDSEDEDEDAASHPRREIRPLPKRARPLIQVLPSGDGDDSPPTS
ncbi:hypothetical protein EDB83DRAFT_2411068 [Lactarius deliciosus]|nr:hypothetical protein EDB83DRAFT_2411068 [Lactarius deliciosus]